MIQPGFINGLNHRDYWEQVLELKRTGQAVQLEQLLLAICRASEGEARYNRTALASAAYKELANLYREKKQDQQELTILQRYVYAAGERVKQELKDRLERVKARLNI